MARNGISVLRTAAASGVPKWSLGTRGRARSGAGFDDFDGPKFAEAGGVEGDGEGLVGVIAGGVLAGGFGGGFFGDLGGWFLGHDLSSHGFGVCVGNSEGVLRTAAMGRQDQISKLSQINEISEGKFLTELRGTTELTKGATRCEPISVWRRRLGRTLPSTSLRLLRMTFCKRRILRR